MPLQARIGEVTERLVRRSRASRTAYLERIDRAVSEGPARKKLGCANFAHGFAACDAARQVGAEGGRGAEPRHRHRLQRHAVGASALRALPGIDQAAPRGGGRHRTGRGRRAGDVRWGHPGRGRHGAFAVLARRHRAVDGGRAVASDVRRRRLSRRLRQDRAGAADRRALLRPSAGRVHSRGADDVGPLQRRQIENPPALCRGQGDAGRASGVRSQGLSRRRAPARSTAPPTPTRC